MPQHDPVGVGILGAGRANIATSAQIPACRASTKVRIVALCDRLEGVREYAEQCGTTGYTDYEAMLADPAVEMVQVATPDWCHCEHTEAALAAGKHVLLQKPPCICLDELDRLRSAIADAPGFLKISLNNRETRRSRTIRKYVDEGAIGELRHIGICHRGKRYPIRDLASPYLTAELGGVWVHNGLHWLDEAHYFCGQLPVAAQVFATRNPEGAPELLGEGPNYWSAQFEMGPQVTFRFEYNTMLMRDGLPGGLAHCLIGTEGELRQTYDSEEILLMRKDEEQPRVCEMLDADASPAQDSIRSFTRLVDAFAEQIRDGDEREPRIDDSLSLTEALLRAADSAAAGERVVLKR